MCAMLALDRAAWRPDTRRAESSWAVLVLKCYPGWVDGESQRILIPGTLSKGGGNQAVISLGRSMHLNWKVLPPWLDTQFSRNQYLHDVNTKNRLDYSALEMNGEDM